jgi:carboxypeptidase family protein
VNVGSQVWDWEAVYVERKWGCRVCAEFLAVCILFLCASSLALAQAGRGSISGTVTDPNGAVVPGAPVTLLNRATGGIQHTVTSGAGLDRFISLNPGAYQVTVSQSGFALPWVL